MPEFKKCKDEYGKISSQSIKLEKELSKFNDKKEKNESMAQELSIQINRDSNMIDSNNRLALEKENLISTFKKDLQINLKAHSDAKQA